MHFIRQVVSVLFQSIETELQAAGSRSQFTLIDASVRSFDYIRFAYVCANALQTIRQSLVQFSRLANLTMHFPLPPSFTHSRRFQLRSSTFRYFELFSLIRLIPFFARSLNIPGYSRRDTRGRYEPASHIHNRAVACREFSLYSLNRK